MSDIGYNPFDPTVRADPYPFYARLRDEHPLYRIQGLGITAVSRYADVHAVLEDPLTFSSTAVRDLFNGLGDHIEDEDAGITGETMVGTDPPVHTRLRKIVNRAFRPSQIAALEPRILELTGQLVGALEGRDTFELMSELAVPLPVTVISEILGVDASRRLDFKRWSDDFLIAATGQPTPEQAASFRVSDQELGNWIDEVVSERRVHPGQDLISRLIAAEASEEVMTAEEVRNLIVLLLVAGNETTTNLIGGSVLALLERRDQLERLRRQPEQIAGAVEELLRFTSPVQLTLRRARRDVELPSGKVAEGEVVAVLLASANRDERQFPDADRLDVSRDVRGHVALGFGTHFCVGANLARLEGAIALRELICGLPAFERVPEPLEYTPSLIVRGPRRVLLRFRS